MKGVPIGLRDLYYAILVNDPVEGGQAEYETPVRIAGAIRAVVNPNSSLETLFYDDGPGETAASLGQITLELNVADLPLSVQAALLGHTFSGGILVRKAGDVPPWVAIGFRSLKSNGKYRYTWLCKGKFNLPEQNNETKGDRVSFNTPTIQGSFVKRDCDDEWERHTDEDEDDFNPDVATNWFNSPYAGVLDTAAPTVTTMPADGASNVAVADNIVMTFSKRMLLSTINGNNIILAKTDGTVIPGSFSVDNTGKIVTFDPTNNLSAGTDYMLIITKNVKSAVGTPIAAPVLVNFSTTS